jgi:bacteriocin-like protein
LSDSLKPLTVEELDPELCLGHMAQLSIDEMQQITG